MASELLFPISLLRAPDRELDHLTIAWANDRHGRGLIAADSNAVGGGFDLFQEIEDAKWFKALDRKTQESILENTNEDAAAWAANRARMPKARDGFQALEGHLHWLKKARDADQQARTKSQSPTVYLPPMAMQRAFKDPTDRRDLAIRDFRILCSLYSWIGRDVARVVRRSAILKRAFGFWSDDHDEAKVENHIRKMQGFDFTERMIRDSLARLDTCKEIIRAPWPKTVTWYARGSTPAKDVFDRITQPRPDRSRSAAVMELLKKATPTSKQWGPSGDQAGTKHTSKKGTKAGSTIMNPQNESL